MCVCDSFKVFYNNINVFKRAKERTSHASSEHVSWSCSSEFDANQMQGISFLHNESYVMLAKPVVQTGERYINILQYLSSSAIAIQKFNFILAFGQLESGI